VCPFFLPWTMCYTLALLALPTLTVGVVGSDDV